MDLIPEPNQIAHQKLSERCRGGAAFTLIEMLVVMAVIAIMASLLLSALNQTKEQGRSVMCKSNMRQVGLGFIMYADDNGDYLPWPGGDADRANTNAQYDADWCFGGQPGSDLQDSSRWSDPEFGFHAQAGSIFTYVTSQPRLPYDNKYRQVWPVYRCPSSKSLGEAVRVNFSANAWLDPGKPFGNGTVSDKGVMTSSVVDPVRKVMLMNENPEKLVNCAFAPGSRGSDTSFILHHGRANIAFIDGHMEAVSEKTLQDMQGPLKDVYYNLGK